jgi:hypothetical protein
MWEPRPLTPLWAFTACYRDSFTFTFYVFFIVIIRRNWTIIYFTLGGKSYLFSEYNKELFISEKVKGKLWGCASGNCVDFNELWLSRNTEDSDPSTEISSRNGALPETSIVGYSTTRIKWTPQSSTKPKVSLPCPQVLTLAPYSELLKSGSHPHILLLQGTIKLAFHIRLFLPSGFFLQDFILKLLCI